MESTGTKSPFWDRPRRRNPRIWSRRGTVAWRVVPRTIRTSRYSIPIINNNLPGNSQVELDPFFLIAIKEITEIGMWILIKRLRDRFYVSQFPSTWKIDRGREIRILQSQNLFIYLFITTSSSSLSTLSISVPKLIRCRIINRVTKIWEDVLNLSYPRSSKRSI